MSAKVAVVIPNHKENLTDLEKISLVQCRKVLGRYPLIHVVPAGKNFSYFEPGEMIVEFPARYFQNTTTYSELLMSPLFYEPFLDFDYILIYQTDAFVFYDALENFCSLGYDYIGAPLPRHTWNGSRTPKTPRVGNGGFSLRNVKNCHKFLNEAFARQDWLKKFANYDEDAFFSICGADDDIDFNVASVEIANLFSMEWYPARHVKRFGLPFGCHHWTKMSADFYVELFARFGYDLKPFREQMGNEDYCIQLPIGLSNVAMERFIRAVDNGRSILHYLPTKRFASIRVIRSLGAAKILARLSEEEKFLSNKIFIYDEENWTDLLDDMTRENLPHLIISADYDVSLVAAVESRGLRYGEHVISFQREYMKVCEKLFHKLGK